MNFMKLLGVRGQRSARSVIGYLLLAIAFLAFCLPPACAQVTPTTGGSLNTALLSQATTYTINSTAVNVQKDRGLGILYSLTAGAVTNSVTLKIQVSNDGTNWATATPFTISQDLVATGTAYIGFTNIPPTVLNNVQYWRLGPITAANTNNITNSISWSVHN